MRKLRSVVVTATLSISLLVGSGVASAGVDWCDSGSPPPMDTIPAIAGNPDKNPNGMPTPLFKNVNGKFTDNQLLGDEKYLAPPGMSKASK